MLELKTPETFFTAVGCMDGRVQAVIAAFGQGKFGAQYPDTITEAGIVGILAKYELDPLFMAGLTAKIVAVSLGKHGSKGIVVHGHAHCAGNPVDDEQQVEDIRKSVSVIQSLVGPKVSVVGAFVKRNNADPAVWEVEELS